MGRYYSGSIDGKFWFGIQSSFAATRFGVGCKLLDNNCLIYNFKENHLEKLNEEIKKIETQLGKKKQKLDVFFENNDGYNNLDIISMGISKEEFSDYADLFLGYKIRDCISKNGFCQFEAEL